VPNLAQPSPLPGWSLAPFGDFADACEAVLAHLDATLPLDAWVVARVDGDDAVVLASAGASVRARPGDTFSWTASISARMLAERGPRVAAPLADVESYRDAPAAREHGITAYAGAPLCRADGTLFGIVAGVGTRPADVAVTETTALIELLARLLGTHLAAELRESDAARTVARADAADMHDGVTGVGNRAYWEQVLVAEESRCRRYGERAAIAVVELAGYEVIRGIEGDDAAQVLLRRAARVLRTECREEDVVARTGDGTFAVLSVGADDAGVAAFAARLERELAANDALASVAYAARDTRTGLHAAWETAVSSASQDQRRPA